MMNIIQDLKKYTQNIKVLYVEDDQTVVTYFKEVYGELFDQVDIAREGMEGLNKYSDYYNKENKFYDLVITDIVMPYMDGKQLIEHILTINPHQNIIVVSAYDDSTQLIDFINLGVDGFILKPFDDQKVHTGLFKVSKGIHNTKELMKRTRELSDTNQQLELKIVRENRLHNEENEVINGLRLLLQSIEEEIQKETFDMDLIQKSFKIVDEKLEDLDQMIV